jgi:hypothetical protein
MIVQCLCLRQIKEYVRWYGIVSMVCIIKSVTKEVIHYNMERGIMRTIFFFFFFQQTWRTLYKWNLAVHYTSVLLMWKKKWLKFLNCVWLNTVIVSLIHASCQSWTKFWCQAPSSCCSGFVPDTCATAYENIVRFLTLSANVSALCPSWLWSNQRFFPMRYLYPFMRDKTWKRLRTLELEVGDCLFFRNTPHPTHTRTQTLWSTVPMPWVRHS